MDLVLQTEREALKLRLLAVLLTVVGLYIAHFQQYWQPVLLVLGYLVYLATLRRLILSRLGLPWAVHSMILVDVAAVSLGLLIGGRIGTGLFVLFPALILYYSIHTGYSSSLSAATMSSLAYPAVAFATGEAEDLGGFLSLQVPLFYMLAVMGGFMAQKRLEERRQKESLQEAIGLERGAHSLLDVTRALGSTLETDAVLSHVVASSLRLSGMDVAAVAVGTGQEGPWILRACSLKPEQLGLSTLTQASEVPGEGSLTALALQTLQPLPVPDIAAETQGVPAWVRSLPHQAMLIVPLVSGDKAIGVIYLLGQRLEPDILTVAAGLSDLAGAALSNAILYEESQARVSRLKDQFGQLVGRVEKLRQSHRKKFITVDGLRLDMDKGEATVEGKAVALSPVEFELLGVLAENAGEPLTHDTLLRLVWGPEYAGQANVLDVSIHRLRRKIEKDPARPDRILTVRGVGYMFSSASASTVARTPLEGKKMI